MLKFIAALVVLSLSSCTSKNIVPEENKAAIHRLLEGNQRYRENDPLHPDQTSARKREIYGEQHPFAVIVSCSDSRVPPELVFDQGLGGLFVIRTAGHALGDFEMASIEYAVEHLHVKDVFVLGHEGCGAIKAFIDHKGKALPGHLGHLVNYISEEPEEIALMEKGECTLEDATIANIKHAVHMIANSKPLLREKVSNRQLNVYGAYYYLVNGQVVMTCKTSADNL
jgi:carbonic anhydrase